MSHFTKDSDSDVFDLIEILSRRRRAVAIAAAAGLALTAAYACLWPPVYQASALLSIDKVSKDIASSEASQETDESYFETQFKLITSETQIRRVYEELKLARVPEFAEGPKALRKAVSVVPLPRARLAALHAESRDPRLAVAIAASLARRYVKNNLDNQLFMSKVQLDALQSRTRDPDARLLIESLPAVVNNKLIQDIKTQIFNDEASLADLQTKFTPNHPDVRALQSRLRALRGMRDREMNNVLGSLKTELSGQLRANNVRVVDEPVLPTEPARPRRGLALILALPIALVLGAFAAVLLESIDKTVRTHHDVERRLGVPFLGLIPHAPRPKGAKVYAPLMAADVSPSSEAFRNLRTIVSLVHKQVDDPILLVTSAVQAEGKSFVSTNLAVALSQLGQRVLIVDGDLRRPNQHLNLSSAAKVGLSDYLAGGVSDLSQVVFRTGIANLDIAACGSRNRSPAELLNAANMAKFVAWARANYHRVIVDCPPVFPVSDVLLWGRHVNSSIFVVRSGRTRVPLIQTACARLRVGGVKIVGGVLNGARIGTTRYAAGHYAEVY